MSHGWDKVRELFERADAVPAAERASWLRAECGDDSALRERVEALLAAETTDTAHPLDGEIPIEALDELQAAPGSALVGRTIGGFRTVDLLGVGGMGVVLRAEQDRPRREVALKVLAGSLVSEATRRRFEYEGETLGKLQHPNIAQVFATGCEPDPVTGQPLFWIAMELIRDGLTLDAYLASADADEAERLRLFLEVCDAIDHGHRQGVLHRDLKPGNILVGSDGRPVVIDFGIARAVDRSASDSSLGGGTLTGQILGTPRYMSPEQLTGDPDAVDTRTDVYALGVILFALLTGQEPHDAKDLSIDSFARLVAERDAPRVSSLRPVAIDLDWVCARALAKAPADRYRSVGELADDLRRYLASEPVHAGPPSTVYVVRRFVRRHRALVAGGAALLAILIGSSVVASLGWSQAARSAELARAEAATQATIVDWLSQLLQSARPEQQGRDIRVIDLLEAGEDRFSALGDDAAEVEAAIRNVVAQTWLSLDQNDRALHTVREGLERMLRELPPPHSAIGESRYLIGVAQGATGDFEGAQRSLEEALRHRLAHAGEDAVETAHVLHALGVNQVRRGAPAEADGFFARAQAVFEATLGPHHDKTLTTIADRIDTAHQLGEYDRVRADLRAALADARAGLGGDHPVTVGLLVSDANDARQGGDLEAAESGYARALEIRRQRYGPHSPKTLRVLGNLAVVRQDRGDHDGAIEAFEQLVDIHESNGDDPLQELIARNNLASTQLRAGRPTDALASYEALLVRAEPLIPTDHWLHATFLRGRGATRSALGQHDAAEADLLRSLEVFEATLGPDNVRTETAVRSLAEHYEAAGSPERAASYRARLDG